jgi:hypothetical protein
MRSKSEKRWDTMSTVAPSFILVTGDGTTIHFPRRRYFLFQPPTQSGRGFKESGSWKFKKIKIEVSSRRNRDSPGAPVISPIGMVICLK